MSTLKGIDLLDKRIRGARRLDQTLCEFAHPNVGVFLSSASKHGLITSEGTRYHHKIISTSAPLGFAMNSEQFLPEVFGICADVLDAYEVAVVAAGIQLSRVQQAAQVVVRRLLKTQKDLVGSYEACPCGSGSKTRFCCG